MSLWYKSENNCRFFMEHGFPIYRDQNQKREKLSFRAYRRTYGTSLK